MQCQYCSNNVPPNVLNCPSCGATVPQPVNAVPQPVNAVPQQQQMPPQGAPQIIIQNISNSPAVSSKSRVVYILLGIFLGGLGIHNFYIGRVGIGIVQLLITLFLGWLVVPLLIVGIWVLLEICIVTNDGKSLRLQ